MPLKNRTGSCKKCKKPGSSIAPSNNSIFQILDELQTSIPSMADIDEESEAYFREFEARAAPPSRYDSRAYGNN